MSGTISKPHELSSEWRRRCCGVKLSSGAVKVCWAMYFGAVHGVSYSSQERLAQETGLDRTDVGKILRAMAAAGLIQAVSDEVLTDALKQDGEPRGDKRLVGYRRVIDPGTSLSKELAAAVVFGKPMDPATKIRISKRNEGSSTEYLRSKRGDHVTLNSNEGNEGNVALNPMPRVETSEESDTPQFEGTVVREVEGTVVPPYEPKYSEEADAERVRISPSVIVEVSGRPSAEDPEDTEASAPEGAHQLPRRLIADIEAAFGRTLHPHESVQFFQVVERLGRGELEDRLVRYSVAVAAGTVNPMPIAKWLRQSGLYQVAHVA